jgi:GTP cyclohydrolase I
MDKERIARIWEQLLQEIGETPDRSGLRDTPKRVAQMYAEIFRGYDPEEKPVIATFPNGEDGITYNQMIIDEGIFSSFCEHHCLPFSGRYWFSYIPGSRILGLSKIAHTINYRAARLQIQERLVKDIISDLWNALHEGTPPKGMALVMKANHLCKQLRGVRTQGEMTTIELRGIFKDDPKTRMEFFAFVGGHHG